MLVDMSQVGVDELPISNAVTLQIEVHQSAIAALEEMRNMKSLVLKSMVGHWLAEGMARARADERALLCQLAGRKFGGQAAERLSAQIEGETDPQRLVEVGDWIIDCGAEAEFLTRSKHAISFSP